MNIRFYISHKTGIVIYPQVYRFEFSELNLNYSNQIYQNNENLAILLNLKYSSNILTLIIIIFFARTNLRFIIFL